MPPPHHNGAKVCALAPEQTSELATGAQVVKRHDRRARWKARACCCGCGRRREARRRCAAATCRSCQGSGRRLRRRRCRTGCAPAAASSAPWAATRAAPPPVDASSLQACVEQLALRLLGRKRPRPGAAGRRRRGEYGRPKSRVPDSEPLTSSDEQIFASKHVQH